MRKPLRLLGKNPHQWIRRKRLPPSPMVCPIQFGYTEIKSGVSPTPGYFEGRDHFYDFVAARSDLDAACTKEWGYTQSPRLTETSVGDEKRTFHGVRGEPGAHTVQTRSPNITSTTCRSPQQQIPSNLVWVRMRYGQAMCDPQFYVDRI